MLVKEIGITINMGMSMRMARGLDLGMGMSAVHGTWYGGWDREGLGMKNS